VRVRELHVRLFKAFNYDFVRLHDSTQSIRPWDRYKGVDYPYITVPLDREVTCIVGANESGKSQVLSALWFALGIDAATSTASCRYSTFFGEDGDLRIAQFGLTLTDLNAADVDKVRDAIGSEEEAAIREVHLFRVEADSFELYVDDETKSTTLTREAASGLLDRLPTVFSIDTSRELPDSVPLDYMLDRADVDGAQVEAPIAREARFEYLDAALDSYQALRELAAKETLTGAELKALLPLISHRADKDAVRRFDLAWHLLVTVSGIPFDMFRELHDALRAEEEGLKTAIVGRMNAQLSLALNMPRWWTQDADFDLQIEAQDYDLVFTIRDRTAAKYKFGERSEGLKYFLSYLVQYLARMQDEVPPTLLTMDEPDAYLSQQGQQDLLALFQDFVASDRQIHRQVVFVTHSPFLIDRNRAERVRVLHKGVEDEGTRVVKKAAHNHFEPLRSAFGGFVGELAFIGNCNLILEGQTDQMYIAALCAEASGAGDEPDTYLDLNKVTLVHAGSTEHVPYMTYLARGRDHEQPAVIVLLDGDKPGNDARAVLEEGFPKPGTKKRAPLVNSKLIAQITSGEFPEIDSERPGGPREIEDLVPLTILHAVALRLAEELCGDAAGAPNLDDVRALLSNEVGHFDALEKAFTDSVSALRLDKFALAHTVIDLVRDDTELPDVEMLRRNFRVLFKTLRELQRQAELERRADGMQRAVRSRIKTFLRHHPARATRYDVRLLLVEIEGLLDKESTWADKVELQRKRIERRLDLREDLASDIANYPKVKLRLEKLLHAAELSIADLTAADDDDEANEDLDETGVEEPMDSDESAREMAQPQQLDEQSPPAQASVGDEVPDSAVEVAAGVDGRAVPTPGS
jgi:energy-coupling factor transporter ATP-binding protein EcfA2